MPRGIYDRSKFKKDGPQAKGEKRTPAKKVIRRKPAAAKSTAGNTSWPAPAPVQAVDMRDYFVIGDSKGLHVFETVDQSVQYLVNEGATADTIGGDIHTRILTVRAAEKPEPKNVRLSYTL